SRHAPLPRPRDGAPGAGPEASSAGQGRHAADRQGRGRAEARRTPDDDGAGAALSAASPPARRPIRRDWKSRHPPVALLADCGYKRAFRTVRQGMPRPFLMLETGLVCRFRLEEWSSKMPKMKTKSSA